MIPPNVFRRAAKGDILGLILFSLLFGYFASRLPESLARTQREFWGGVREVMLNLTGFVMRFAPLGVFGLVTRRLRRPASRQSAARILFCVGAAWPRVPLVCRPAAHAQAHRARVALAHLRAMTPALLTAFSSSSFGGDIARDDGLPATPRRRVRARDRIRAAARRDDQSRRQRALRMRGGNVLAQAYGLNLDFHTQFIIVWMALITSMGISGIPSSSLVAIAIILGAIGLPLDAVGMILAVDRVLDMCRTAVNVFGDSCGAVIVARLDGEEVLQKPIS